MRRGDDGDGPLLRLTANQVTSMLMTFFIGIIKQFSRIYAGLFCLLSWTHAYHWLAAPTDEGDASDHSEKAKNAKR